LGFPSRPKNGLSLCGGAGGIDMGLHLAEPQFRTLCWVEIEPEPRKRIIAAQSAGYFAPAPIWDDVTTFDGTPFRGAIDTILAGYPCQPFSMAGQRRGADDERHLWPDVARIIREVQPSWVFLENVAGHVSLGAETVLRELWDMGWTPAAGLFSAQEVGASHERLRWFCVAHKPGRGCGVVGDAAQPGRGRHADGGNVDLADADGWNPGAERQQRGGQQRLHPEGGGVVADRDRKGCGQRPEFRAGWGEDQGECRADADGLGNGALDHPTGARCDGAGIGPEADCQGIDRGREQQAGGTGCLRPGFAGGYLDVADAVRGGTSAGPGPHAQTAAQPAGRGERAKPGDGDGQMADAGRPGLQRRERRGPPVERNRPPAHGPASERGSLPIFPPGPGDATAWSAVLASARHLAPSASARDLHAWARSLEADGHKWWQAEAEPEFRRMVDGISSRSSHLRILGNAVVPISAAYAWRALASSHGLETVDLGEAN